MAHRQRKPIFSARQGADCNGSGSGGGGGAGWPEACGESGLLMCLYPSPPPLPLNAGAMLIAWCSDIWKPPSGGQIAQAFCAQDFRNILKWSHLLYRDENHSNGGGRIFLSCHNMASLSEVCHAIFGQKRRRQAFARSVPLIFISAEVNEFNTWALFFFFQPSL